MSLRHAPRSPTSQVASPTPSAGVQLRRAQVATAGAPARPLQYRGDGDHAASARATAAAGVKGSGGGLPHGAAIQRSFGRHDVGHVQAHVGGDAAKANEQLGAQAYASGAHVAFKGAPDLHTTAHEAAHVVQQRAGVALAGGVGASGDRYEQHADAVADAVVQGKSAEPLLDRMAGSGGGAHEAVQRKGEAEAPTHAAPVPEAEPTQSRRPTPGPIADAPTSTGTDSDDVAAGYVGLRDRAIAAEARRAASVATEEARARGAVSAFSATIVGAVAGLRELENLAGESTIVKFKGEPDYQSAAAEAGIDALVGAAIEGLPLVGDLYGLGANLVREALDAIEYEAYEADLARAAQARAGANVVMGAVSDHALRALLQQSSGLEAAVSRPLGVLEGLGLALDTLAQKYTKDMADTHELGAQHASRVAGGDAAAGSSAVGPAAALHLGNDERALDAILADIERAERNLGRALDALERSAGEVATKSRALEAAIEPKILALVGGASRGGGGRPLLEFRVMLLSRGFSDFNLRTGELLYTPPALPSGGAAWAGRLTSRSYADIAAHYDLRFTLSIEALPESIDDAPVSTLGAVLMQRNGARSAVAGPMQRFGAVEEAAAWRAIEAKFGTIDLSALDRTDGDAEAPAGDGDAAGQRR